MVKILRKSLMRNSANLLLRSNLYLVTPMKPVRVK